MNRILITGADSYIGTSVEKWLGQSQFAGMYQTYTVDMKNPEWKKVDFSGYDTVFHVAGIAHADIGKVTEEQKKLYYAINCELAVETAKKAKLEGVKQFIYMSSIIVYGEGTSVRKKRVITRKTEPSPSNFYGDSKWKAEQKLMLLSNENFRIAILRPPMIYGKGCKGNYQTLKKVALRVPIFPDFPNERSVCSIENLCEFVRNIIDKRCAGLYFPQNSQYMSTSELVRDIASDYNKDIRFTKLFNWLIYIVAYCPGKIGKLVKKAYGSLIYKDIDLDYVGQKSYQSDSVNKEYQYEYIGAKLCSITTVSKVMEWFIVQPMKHLHNNGFEITLCSNMNDKFIEENKSYAKCVPLPLERGFCMGKMLKTVFLLIKLFRQEKYDIIQYCSPNAALCASLAGMIAGIKIRIYNQWGIRYVGYTGGKRYFLYLLEKIICGCSTAIQPDSYGNVEFSVEERLYRQKKSEVIWNGSACGVDLSKFSYANKERWRMEIREKLEIKSNALILIFVGRVTRDKGVKELLLSFENLEKIYLHLELIIVGDLDEINTLDYKLIKWARNNKRIHFIGRSSRVEQYLAASDIFILPSYREGFGSVVIEAEAMGLPVVVSDIPGPREAIIEGKTGLTFTIKSVEQLKEKIQFLIENNGVREKMGMEGKQFVIENFEQRQFLDHFLNNRRKYIVRKKSLENR